MAEGVKEAAERRRSGAAAADPRRLPTLAAAGEPTGAARCPRAPTAPSPSPSQAPSPRIPASPTLESPLLPQPRAPAGAERAHRGRCAGLAAGRRARPGALALPQFFAATGSAGAGSPLSWAPRRPLPPGGGRQEGRGRTHTARTCRLGTGTARRCSPASIPPSLPPFAAGHNCGPRRQMLPPLLRHLCKVQPAAHSHTHPPLLPAPPHRS